MVREGYFDTNTGRKHGTNPANQIKSSQLRNLYQLISSFFDLFTYGKQLIIDESKKILIRAKVKIAYQIGRDAKKEIGVWVFNHYTNICSSVLALSISFYKLYNKNRLQSNLLMLLKLAFYLLLLSICQLSVPIL